jgi:hypothetical protein
MDDKTLGKMIKTIEKDIKPPVHLREKILGEITKERWENNLLYMNPFERFIFQKPLKAACVLSAAISGFLWAVMGSGYSDILFSVVGKR